MLSCSSFICISFFWGLHRKARIPEPLNRVLDPISIRHLDLDDVVDAPVEARNKHVKLGTRHGSLEGDDPGVIGPVVWDRHCQQIHGLQRGIHLQSIQKLKIKPLSYA